MKTPVEQAKAAILYPPKGLNCLITGPTGSGKTYFAHAMFQFAKLNQIVAKEKSLWCLTVQTMRIIQNFDVAFIWVCGRGLLGATKAKEGIIDEADGSILF